MNHYRPAILPVLAAILLLGTGHACTTFLLESGDELIFGRNYDWSLDDGLIITNKRNIAKTAMTEENPAGWTSKYGSITFNQFGRELPLGGMNETGLIVEVMWLDESEYPKPGPTPTVTDLQWVQYQLDNFSTVKEVLAGSSRVTVIDGGHSTIHYLIADAIGDCAAVEFLKGIQVHHTGPDLPHRALTNNTYDDSRQSLRDLKPFGGTQPLPTGFGSLARFARAALYVERYDPADSVSVIDYAFDALAAVSSGMFTKWSIVYDVPARTIRFRTFRNQQIRTIDLEAFDFAGSTPVKMLDVNARPSGKPDAGDVTAAFTDYTLQANRDLIYRVFRGIAFLRDVPDEALDAIARYPETTTYVE